THQQRRDPDRQATPGPGGTVHKSAPKDLECPGPWRRLSIGIATLLMSVCVLGIGGFIHRPVVVLILVFLCNCFASSQDVAVDAFAVDHVFDKDRGRLSASMWAAKLLGFAVGGSFFSVLIGVMGFTYAAALLAALLVLTAGAPFFVASTYATEPHRSSLALASLFRELRIKGVLPAMGVALFALVAQGLYRPISADLLTRELSWGAEVYSLVAGTFGTLGRALGALLSGFLADRLGARRVVTIGMIGTAALLGLLSSGFAFWASQPYALGILHVCVQGAFTFTGVALCAHFLKVARGAASATQFTILTMLMNLGLSLGSWLTWLELPLPAQFSLCGVLAVMPVILLWESPAPLKLRWSR
ncbi:MAG: MFS transporter, partial [Myxococcota bacterium]